MKTDLIELTQRKVSEERAKKYIAQVKRKHIAQEVFGYVALVLIALSICVVGTSEFNALAKEEGEQKYIVRYGTTEDYGSVIITEDGHEWNLEDAPEYEDGTEVRVLFDSKETQNVTDDIPIDVTERR